MLDFWTLTEAEIRQGIELIRNPTTVDPNHPLRQFTVDFVLQELAQLYIDSDHDIHLMKIKYYDTIHEIYKVQTCQRINGHA